MASTFSVLISVYAKEQPAFLDACLESMVRQTMMPSRIVVVKDGALPDGLEQILNRYIIRYPELFTVVGYEQNKGLGHALDYGLSFIATEYVARMDADDVAVPTRFAVQMRALASLPEIDVLGSWISEFETSTTEPLRNKIVPQSHDEIMRTAKFQNPVNHMTVIFKKNSVIRAGGYMHQPYFEDYALWVRMLHQGMRFHNLQQPLVLARIGNDMIGKRHGWQYMKHEFNHFAKMYQIKFITLPKLLLILMVRLPLRLVPKGILALFYKFALRKKNA